MAEGSVGVGEDHAGVRGSGGHGAAAKGSSENTWKL